MPSFSGIVMSIVQTSGLSSAYCSTASLPFAASPTTSWPFWTRMFLIIIRMNAASSVIRTRAISCSPRRGSVGTRSRRDLQRRQGDDLHGVLAVHQDEASLREGTAVDQHVDSIGRSAVELDDCPGAAGCRRAPTGRRVRPSSAEKRTRTSRSAAVVVGRRRGTSAQPAGVRGRRSAPAPAARLGDDGDAAAARLEGVAAGARRSRPRRAGRRRRRTPTETSRKRAQKAQSLNAAPGLVGDSIDRAGRRRDLDGHREGVRHDVRGGAHHLVHRLGDRRQLDLGEAVAHRLLQPHHRPPPASRPAPARARTGWRR